MKPASSNALTRRDLLALAAGSPLVAAGTRLAAGAQAPRGRYLGAAREFLDTLITKGTDRFGRTPTPLFCLSLDPETYAPPRPPVKIDRQYAISFEYLYRDFGYYWKSHLHSSNLIYDQGTIRALYALSEAAGDAKYAGAADACLDFFLDNMVSEQTGIFGWGEHIFYNVFLDYIIGGAFTVRNSRNFSYNHELDRWTTIYDVFWQKDPAKTLTEIESIYEYKVHDPKTFLFNRHSDYYSGRRTSDTLTFVKHSGLFVHAFSLAYSKTGEKKYLDWARGMADLFWNIRDPRTNLVRNCIQREEENASPDGMAQLVLFLLRAYQWHPEALYLERALAYLEAYERYFLAEDGRFRDQVQTDGTDQKPGQYAPLWPGPVRIAKSAALAASLSGDPQPLKLARTIVEHLSPGMRSDTVVERSLVSDEIEFLSCALSTTIDLYEITADRKYLEKAEALAGDAIGRFLDRGLLVSSLQLDPEGDKSAHTQVYDARTGAGWLALNLIRLQRDLNRTADGSFARFDRLERIYD
jgi:uncharacterized protein YyaL (SSP411 family)